MNDSRNGIPTSSSMWKLLTKGTDKKKPGKPFLTYVEEKQFENLLNRSINKEEFARATSWGHAVEGFVHLEYLALEYKLTSNDTIVHESNMFAGTPDVVSQAKVGDIKCPYTIASFMKLRKVMLAGDVEEFKKSHPEYFWQLVSNAILTDKKQAELIVFCPKQSQLEAIRDYVENIDDINVFKYKFVVDCSDEELPFIPENSEVEPLVRFTFEVTKDLEAELIECVNKANQLINTI